MFGLFTGFQCLPAKPLMADSSQTQSSDHWVTSSTMITDSSDVSDIQTNSLSSLSSTNSGFVAPSPPPVSHSPSMTSLTSIERLEQENRVLKIEIETLKLRIKSLIEENKSLRRASVSIQAKAEQEEEFISNTLLKRIQVLKKEKETLALNYEHEEECLTNDLSRKLNQLRAEKVQLERTLEHEQEALVNKLMRKIEKLENETQQKQNNLEQLRREKIELENTLEQEQEALVNKLWKRMDKLESEKRVLQHKLEDFNKSGDLSMSSQMSGHSTPAQSPGPQPMSPASSMGCPSPAPPVQPSGDPVQLSMHIQTLRNEVSKLKSQLLLAENEHKLNMDRYEKEEREQKEQNIRLQRKLQIEMERREQLCRHLSESESSLEMDEERQFNEQVLHHQMPSPRPRTLSSPVPPSLPMTSAGVTPVISRPLSPSNQQHCPNCGHSFPMQTSPIYPVKPMPTASQPKDKYFMKPN